MDRLPRDIAQERMHHDIVNLLDKHQGDNPMMNGFTPSPNTIMPAFMHHSAGGSVVSGGHHTGVKKKKKGGHKSRTMSSGNREPRSISPHSKHQVVKLPPAHQVNSAGKKKRVSKKAEEAAASAAAIAAVHIKKTDSPCNISPEGTLELPPSYESAISGQLTAMAQPHVHSMEDLYTQQRSCRYNSELNVVNNGVELNTDNTQQPQQQNTPTNSAINKSTGSLDLDHIKVEELSPENLFEAIEGGEICGGGRTTRLPSTSSHSLSSPTSGYNTIGSSPGISASPFSSQNSVGGGISSPHSIQSPHSSQTGSPMMYPASLSPPEMPAVPSPPRGSKYHHPLSPTHLQVLTQNHHHRINSNSGSSTHNPNGINSNSTNTSTGNSGTSTQPTHAYHYYPTPPSQHSQHNPADSTPPMMHHHHLAGGAGGQLVDPHTAYLTPSPDSPGHWSSSSPNSAHSDCWSPPQLSNTHLNSNHMYTTNAQQQHGNKPDRQTGGNAVYL